LTYPCGLKVRSKPHGAAPAPGLRRELTLFDVAAIVVGTIIGSGIFLIPSIIAAHLDSFGAVLLVWAAGGLVTVCGALSLAELGSMYPGTGGLCSYLQNAYGPLPAFLYAWGLLVMIHSGSIAALAVAFGLYMGQILPFSTVQERSLSVACIVVLTVINCLGIRGGKLMQNINATAKITGLAGIILLLWVRGSRPLHFFEATPRAIHSSLVDRLADFGIAAVAVLWAYEAWHVVSFVAGEMKNPQGDLPRGLFLGTGIVMVIYLAANFGYYHVLSSAEIRSSKAVAAFAIGRLLGPAVASSVSLLILISILGSMNGMILTGPRVYYAMARQGVFPRALGQISGRYRAPICALILQGIWAAFLAGSGGYQQILTNVIFTAWIFYGLAVAAVVVLRINRPESERPFRCPVYPWLPLLFCVCSLGLVLNTILTRPGAALAGIALIGIGVPAYYIIGTWSSPTNRLPPDSESNFAM
jgi:basic amino acid/polyamine antiporter, APA family